MPTSVDSEKRSVISGLFWKFGERALAQVVSFVVSLVLARLLTPSEYGVVAMVLVFIALADVFAGSGFATGLIQKKDADERDFSTMFYCSLACSVLLYGVIFACAPAIAGFYSEPSLVLILRVFALRIPLSAVNAIQHAYVSRHMLFKRFFYSTLVGAVVSGVVGIVLALLGFGVWALIDRDARCGSPGRGSASRSRSRLRWIRVRARPARGSHRCRAYGRPSLYGVGGRSAHRAHGVLGRAAHRVADGSVRLVRVR